MLPLLKEPCAFDLLCRSQCQLGVIWCSLAKKPCNFTVPTALSLGINLTNSLTMESGREERKGEWTSCFDLSLGTRWSVLNIYLLSCIRACTQYIVLIYWNRLLRLQYTRCWVSFFSHHEKNCYEVACSTFRCQAGTAKGLRYSETWSRVWFITYHGYT